MKKVCVTNISKDPFWKMPKSYEELLQKRFANKFDFHFVESTSGLRENLGDCHGIIGMPFSQGAVRKNTNLENVHFWTAQVPLSWQKIADKSSLRLSSSSGVNSSSVAEHGLFLTMKALRGEIGSESLRRDGFLIAQSPKNKTLGILGLGNIGEQYLKLTRSLFGRVIACSRSEKNLSQLDQFYSLSQRTDFFSLCDYLVICLPLTEETIPLLKDENFYNRLRENVVIINLARGELFDENQLCSFLKSHNKSCYLTDVTYPEPYPEDGVLSQLDQVFITPHIGGRREDIWNLLIERTINELENWK